MMKAEDIMTKDVITIRGSATVAEAVRLMKDHNLRALVVDRRYDNDAYGMVSETDIVYKVIAYGKDPKLVRVYEIMSKPCIVVNPELSVEYVARLFANTGIRRAPVIQGKLLGIISITDILTKSNFIEAPTALRLDEKIQKAVETARAICTQHGAYSKACAAAWDEVEELQAEAAHQKAEAMVSAKVSFEEYCRENPNAPECRNYNP
ncbi:CBS domain-containing protein [Nostoc sp. FACHB-87]|uniref:CBS domain-containing protein n=1 Tax=Nostocales TaxID=1161 RepID=UPI001682BD96|nr:MULTISPECIES: CBS domain-containing protein [Nostocales]MBD2297772.1 CBS domain-containing protein [Nostoc sp. FACHB-190]MBD2454824.1 CBS domain-containing protein [Nostoc sp. FACHB-87]MBD2476718.1 CBS domain-containing protein [Anabaena sp. FACHB-83]MBD2487533.1 CBS domain-containing protein [Aulosira sp. FACHB-615]